MQAKSPDSTPTTDAAAFRSVIANPVIHDKSDSIETGAPAAGAEDREVRYRGSGKLRGRTIKHPEGMSYDDTQQFINHLPVKHPRRDQFVTGSVNMNDYLAWLNKNGYGLDDVTVH